MAQFFKPLKTKRIDAKHKAINIIRLDHLGAGIGLLDKKTVFIDGVLPEERALVQLTENKKNYAKAKLIKLLTPSSERVDPFCRHYQECGGCNLQHLSLAGQIKAKQSALDELMSKFSGQELDKQEKAQQPPILSADHAYRRRARLSLQFDRPSNALLMGFRKRQSKSIVDVRECPVLTQPLESLLGELHCVLNGLSARRDLGHVELVEASTGRVCLLRHLKPLSVNDLEQLTAFAKQHQLTLFLSPDSNVVDRVYGEAPYYEIDGVEIAFTPQDFIQVNRQVNEDMVQQAISWLDLQSSDRVLDLFCGLGNFSLPLAKRVNHVVGVEGVEEMVRCAQINAESNGLSNVSFHHANLELDITKQAWAKNTFSKIVLDPARAGAPGVMEYVAKLQAHSIVYVSCNPATLARDSQVLLQSGYRLQKLGILDMFPHTGHLESMALFQKNK
ncbi:23S rRNA (uracil(1939)-C(5))-methyltransferase RlmD [Aliivibrio kagoshimensis]|uniref:23S rRNA (uracil(1939)-C(5))-methyltransferase RlmD n=1 Tax=Aliivibrio kagoshimensis TaxID=2910230 RepID=UPI003D11FD66